MYYIPGIPKKKKSITTATVKGKEVEFVFEHTTTMAPLFGSLYTDYCNKMNGTIGCGGIMATPRGLGKIEFVK